LEDITTHVVTACIDVLFVCRCFSEQTVPTWKYCTIFACRNLERYEKH